MTKRILPLIGMALLSGPLAAQVTCTPSPCVNFPVNWIKDGLFIYEVNLAGELDQNEGFNPLTGTCSNFLLQPVPCEDAFGTTPQQIGQNVMNLDAYFILDGGVGPSPYPILPSDFGVVLAMNAYLKIAPGATYSKGIIGVKNPLSVRAPEIDPTSAASGLTLLLGGLMVLRGRRQMKPS